MCPLTVGLSLQGKDLLRLPHSARNDGKGMARNDRKGVVRDDRMEMAGNDRVESGWEKA